MDAIITDYLNGMNITNISIKHNRTPAVITTILLRAGDYKPKQYVCCYCKSKFSFILMECRNCGAPIKE